MLAFVDLPLTRKVTKGQRSLIFTQVTRFENALRFRRFIYPNFLFGRCLVEMIVLPRNIVLLGKAMYQIAFLNLEFSQKSVVVATVERYKFENFVKNSSLHSL